MTTRIPNPILDVERELSVAVKLAGGMRVDELTGPKPGHRIADFVFDEYAVVAELKCLRKDQINDPSFIEKISSLYIDQSKFSKAMPIVYGEVRMTTQGMSDAFQLRVAELYSTAVSRVVASANEQIGVTKERLNRSDYRGVLFLANDGNSAMHPNHVVWALRRCLRKGAFSHINHVIFFTVNMPVVAPGERVPEWVDDQTDLHVWYSGARKDLPALDAGFEPRIRGAWLEHLKSIVGQAGEFDADKDILRETFNRSRP